MNNEDRLSKRGINLIFSKIKEGDNIVFSPLRYENDLFKRKKLYNNCNL